MDCCNGLWAYTDVSETEEISEPRELNIELGSSTLVMAMVMDTYQVKCRRLVFKK